MYIPLSPSATLQEAKMLNLLAPCVKSWAFADGIDQDQTAQNEQSDLGCLLVNSNLLHKILCGIQ